MELNKNKKNLSNNFLKMFDKFILNIIYYV